MRIPGIQRAVGYAVGIGVRPEHVREEPTARPARSRMSKIVFAGLGIAIAAAALGWAVKKTPAKTVVSGV